MCVCLCVRMCIRICVCLREIVREGKRGRGFEIALRLEGLKWRAES